ncbi:MAG: hypothetical protein HZC37_30770 [Burkholderiales bacterium]|nr:hypothetical protein [Burkholderiales bacterium]
MSFVGALRDAFNIYIGDAGTKIGLWIAAVALLSGFVAAYLAWKPERRARRVQRAEEDRFALAHVERDEYMLALRHYIDPDCTAIDPTGEDDLRAAVPTRQPIQQFWQDILDANSKYKHTIVLADTGMGKTSLLYKLVHSSLTYQSSRNVRVIFVPLGRPGAVQKIAAVERKNETVLLLDALDEDTQAVEDHAQRTRELMSAAQDFYRVVLTCRTQFFARDEEIPRETGIVRISPRGAGLAKEYRLYKVYLAPFNEQQVNAWLTRRFPWFAHARRAKARALIAKLPELVVRPLLLTALPDLVEDGVSVANVHELYARIVHKWLVRERASEREQKSLLQLSQRIAMDVYLNRVRRQSERIPPSEMRWILTAGEDLSRLRSRSLLNRDREGNLKFAHRSMMEYLFVAAFLNGERACLNAAWTDFMIELFWNAVDSSVRDEQLHKRIQDILTYDDIRGPGILVEGKRLGFLKESARKVRASPDKYEGLSVRIGRSDGLYLVCDLLGERIFEFDGYGRRETTPLEVGPELRAYIGKFQKGVSPWRPARSDEVLGLLRFKTVRPLAARMQANFWATDAPGRHLSLVRLGQTPSEDTATVVLNRQRGSDHGLRGIAVLVMSNGALEYYYARLRGRMVTGAWL